MGQRASHSKLVPKDMSEREGKGAQIDASNLETKPIKEVSIKDRPRSSNGQEILRYHGEYV